MKAGQSLTMFAFVLRLAAQLSGQGTTGSISGVVTHDDTPLAGVTITIASSAMQGTRSSVSSFAIQPFAERDKVFDFRRA